ncbi:MAG: lactate permease LctP family transporter, partial [Planctomycetes bacterium]|nr:lactate permease LctP family transporter [Planctomycetota bacterium]
MIFPYGFGLEHQGERPGSFPLLGRSRSDLQRGGSPVVWTQNYDPFHQPLLSTLVAALPVVLLLGLLATGRFSAPRAALVGLLAAVLVAIFAFTPPQVTDPASGGTSAWAGTVLMAATNGAAFGLLPIGWIVLSAIFLYDLTVATGQFEIVKHSVLTLSDDRRLQALMIAFCFGAFIEGAAGFGTPVAISAALLLGAGFRPLHAAGLALIANTSPVAFGALGTPILTLAKVTLPAGMAPGTWEFLIGQMAGRQLALFSLLIPGWLVFIMGGWRAVAGVWPALLVCGGSFAGLQLLVSNFMGPSLVGVIAGLGSLVALALFLRVWQPAQVWRFSHERDLPVAAPAGNYTRGQMVRAWVPWVLLSILVFLWGLAPVKNALDRYTAVEVAVPRLDHRVQRVPPVVPQPSPGQALKAEEATFKLNWLSTTGTSIFLAAVLSSFWLGIRPLRFLTLFARTCQRMRWPLFTIACMLALAFVTRFSGLDATLGLAFTHAGAWYPLCAPLLGWLGVALTGSDTSSNALFGSLQKITAQGLVSQQVLPSSLSRLQAVILLATANSTG